MSDYDICAECGDDAEGSECDNCGRPLCGGCIVALGAAICDGCGGYEDDEGNDDDFDVEAPDLDEADPQMPGWVP